MRVRKDVPGCAGDVGEDRRKGRGGVLGVMRSPRAAGRGRLDWAARAHIGGCGSTDFMRRKRETEVGQCGPREAGRVALR